MLMRRTGENAALEFFMNFPRIFANYSKCKILQKLQANYRSFFLLIIKIACLDAEISP